MASPAPIPISDLSDEEFERRTLAAIHRELGPGGVVRFLMAFRSGKGDYTAECQKWQDTVTLEEIWRDMEAQGLTQKSDPIVKA
jgi:hypothetical protein